MRSSPRFSRLAFFILLLSSIHAAASTPKVAVLDFTLSPEIDPSLAIPVTETIMEALVGSKTYTVLDRAYVGQVLKEKEFQLSGMVSDSEAAAAGQYLGADYVVAGKAQLAAGTFFLVAKMIDVKTGVIAAQASEQADGKPIILLELARKAGGKIAGMGPSLAPSIAAASSSLKVVKVGVIHGNSGFM